MPKEEVSIQINTDDADLLLVSPPRSVKRPLVRIANEERNRHRALAVPECAMWE
jgi:hypothetical protein